VNIPVWHRLPSESITFGSAEIFTIPEVVERFREMAALEPSHADDDGGNSLGRSNMTSVRVTGVVWHRHVHSDGSVSLVLRDPLTPIQSKTTPAAAATAGRPMASILKRPRTESHQLISLSDGVVFGGAHQVTPAAADASVVPTTFKSTSETSTETKQAAIANNSSTVKTPSAGNENTVIRPLSTALNNKNKTFVYKKTNTSGRRLSFAGIKPGLTSGESGGIGAKRRLPSSTVVPQDPLDAMVKAIAGAVPCVWVAIAPGHHQLSAVCAVNDLAMIIGETQTVALQMTGHQPTTSAANQKDMDGEVAIAGAAHSDVRCSAVTEVIQKLLTQGSMVSSQNGKMNPMHCLNARIVRNANGTDMRLHTEALVTRRLFMQEQRRLRSTLYPD
jgi:hypothetical protein